MLWSRSTSASPLQKKPPVIIKEVSDALEDEDIIEMVNAGLLARTVIKLPIATFWKQVFPQITVNDNAKVRTGGEIAWAMRKDSPQLKAAVDELHQAQRQGHDDREHDPGALPEERQVREERHFGRGAQEVPRLWSGTSRNTVTSTTWTG